MGLIDNLIKHGWLKSKPIIGAFSKIKRADFLPKDKKELAKKNCALSIGYNQTISQPLVVAFMLELLQPKLGDKILDIGAGSGWTTALLAELVGERGKVVAIEIVPELFDFGRKNVAKYGFLEKNVVKYVQADGSKGFPEEAPFDKILSSASALSAPEALKEQLKVGGRLVCPIKNSIWLFVKKSDRQFDEQEFPGFVFVPLIVPLIGAN